MKPIIKACCCGTLLIVTACASADKSRNDWKNMHYNSWYYGKADPEAKPSKRRGSLSGLNMP